MDTQNTSTAADNTSSEPKYCINCKHIGTNGSGDADTYKCFAPQNPSTRNLVTGTKNYTLPYCRDHREHVVGYITCGIQGSWYELKPLKPVSENTYTYGGADEVTPAQLAAKIMAAKNKKIL